MEAGNRVPNREQQAVIDDLDRNIILFASAGTGKTFTVARRVQAIIASGWALPSEILCLTFTIRAANEMKDDITEYAGEEAKDVTVSTIHSFAYQVLKEEYIRNPEFYTLPTVCDEAESFEIASRVLVVRCSCLFVRIIRIRYANWFLFMITDRKGMWSIPVSPSC